MAFLSPLYRRDPPKEQLVSNDDKLRPVAQLHRFHVYAAPGSLNRGRRVLKIVDFGRRVSSETFNPEQGPQQFRISTHEVDEDFPFAIHPRQPLLAYFDGGRLKIKDIQQNTSISPSSRSLKMPNLPMIWTADNILELIDSNGTAHHYNITTSRLQPSPEPSARYNLSQLLRPFIVTSLSVDGWRAIVQGELPSETADNRGPQLYHLDLSNPNRTLEPVGRYPNSALYATLLSIGSHTFLVQMVEDRSDYMVQLSHCAHRNKPPPIVSQSTTRPITSAGEIQHIRFIDALSPHGLILVAFESETHIFAMKPTNDCLHRIFPPPGERDLQGEQAIVETIVDQCSHRDVESGAKLSKEKLLSCVTGPSAAAFADLLQSVLDSLDEDSESRSLILSLLYDVCSISEHLPSSYWTHGGLKIGRYVRGGGEAILSRGLLTKDGVTQKVIIRQSTDLNKDDRDSTQDLAMLAAICREVVTHRQLIHPNIVKLLGIWKDEMYPIYMVLPFLSDTLRARLEDGRLSFWDASLDVIRGIVYLHSREPPVIHGDLHPGNILIGTENQAVLCDFGLSRVRHPVARTKTTIKHGANRRYAAPELPEDLSESKLVLTDEKSDVYSLSMTLFFFRTLIAPFDGLRDMEAAEAAKVGERPRRPDVEPEVRDDKLWALFEEMWSQKPSGRPTAEQALQRITTLRLLHSFR